MKRRYRASLALATGLLLSSWFYLETGHGAAGRVFTLHIVRQPLDAALLEFSRQSGVQVLFFSRVADGRYSPALDGTYTLDAAMVTMLSESHLTYRVINSQTIEVVPARPTASRDVEELETLHCT